MSAIPEVDGEPSLPAAQMQLLQTMLPFDAPQVLRGAFPASPLAAARAAARTYAEQIYQPNNPLATELQRVWWRLLSERYPNDAGTDFRR